MRVARGRSDDASVSLRDVEPFNTFQRNFAENRGRYLAAITHAFTMRLINNDGDR